MDNPFVRQEDDYPLTHVFYSRPPQNRSNRVSSPPRPSFLDTFSQQNPTEDAPITPDNLTHVLPPSEDLFSLD